MSHYQGWQNSADLRNGRDIVDLRNLATLASTMIAMATKSRVDPM
ncbi:protein of unknown function [Pararobbsia alpina]